VSRRPSPAVFRSKELNDFLKELSPKDNRRRWVEDMEDILKENIFAGEPIPKSRIPTQYIRRYGVNNLYRYAHPKGYRSCYSLIYKDGLGVCPLIIDIMSHIQYDRVFHYRGE